MRTDKKEVVQLRRKGLSYNKISKKLRIPKSTLASWFSQIDWSKSIRDDLLKKSHVVSSSHIRYMNEIRLKKWEVWKREAREDGENMFPDLKDNPLFITGIMLYWGEGDRKLENSIVRFTNTDSNMIRLFLMFLYKICLVKTDQIRIALMIYKDLDEKECKKYWIANTGLFERNFVKTQCIRGRHPTRRLEHGICTVYISSRQLKEKIIIWIKLLSNNLINAGVV